MTEILISTCFEVITPYEILDEGEHNDGIVLTVAPSFITKYYEGENISNFTMAIFKNTDFLEEVGLLYEDLLSYESDLNKIVVWITHITINGEEKIEIDFQDDNAIYEDSSLLLTNGLFEPKNQ